MRIGIFGGSFDPIHNEHIALAKRALTDLSLDRLFVMPAANPPHKPWRALSTDEARIALCRLAFLGEDRICVSDYECKAGGTSYTYLTVRHFKEAYPEAELFFLMGTDMLRNFPTWKNPEDILKHCRLAVCARAAACKACKKRDLIMGNILTELCDALLEHLKAGGESHVVGVAPTQNGLSDDFPVGFCQEELGFGAAAVHAQKIGDLIGMAEQGIDVGVKYLGNGGEQDRGGNAFAALPFADGFGGIPQTLSQLDLCKPLILAKLLQIGAKGFGNFLMIHSAPPFFLLYSIKRRKSIPKCVEKEENSTKRGVKKIKPICLHKPSVKVLIKLF